MKKQVERCVTTGGWTGKGNWVRYIKANEKEGLNGEKVSNDV